MNIGFRKFKNRVTVQRRCYFGYIAKGFFHQSLQKKFAMIFSQCKKLLLLPLQTSVLTF